VLPTVKSGVDPLDTVIVGDTEPCHSNFPAPLAAVPIAAWVTVPPVPPLLVPKVMAALGEADAGLDPDIVQAGVPLFRETAAREYPV
jgi:hypothetical protein